jgi:NADH-quinone oxidoreductase subunit H
MLIDFCIVLVKIIVAIAGILTGALILTWVERKQSAFISDRIGANRAAILGIRLWGLINSLADALKLATKEDYVPSKGVRAIHLIAPILALFPVFVTFAVIPFGPPIELFGRTINLQILNIDIGVLYILAFGGMGVYAALLAGWSSNNKFSLMGGMRASAQMISYELIIGLAIIGLVLVYGTLEPLAIVQSQNTLLWGWLPRWGIIVQPIAFLLFLPATMAETKRAPFDLPEGESEIIGFHTEYSGMRWGMFFLGEFAEICVLATVLTTFFLGGYHIPYLYAANDMIDTVTRAQAAGFYFPGGSFVGVAPWLVTVLRVLAFGFKGACFMWLQVQIRWTYPRFRYDQLMRLSWREMMPVALLNIGVTGLIVMLWK